MKIRTKMLSYATAVLMMASTFLSCNPLTIDAFAASDGTGTTVVGNTGYGLWGVNNIAPYIDPMIQVYLTTGDYADSRGDSGYITLSKRMTNLTKHRKKEVDTLTTYRDDGSLYIFPTTDDLDFSSIIMDVTDVNRAQIYKFDSKVASEIVDGKPQAITSDSKSESLITESELGNYGAFDKIFANVGNVYPAGSGGEVTIDVGTQLFKNYKSYRESVDYSAEQEWNDIIKPYLEIIDNPTISAAALSDYEAGKPVSLAFEVYTAIESPDLKHHYVCVQAVQSYGHIIGVTPDSYSNAEPFVSGKKVLKESLLWGEYYVYPALRDALVPSYNKNVILPEDTKALQHFKSTDPNDSGTQVGGGGWAYYSFCSKPGFLVDVNITKKWKYTSDPPLTSDEKKLLKNSSVSSLAMYGPIASDVIRADIKDKTGEDAPSVITPEYLYNYLMAHYMKGEHYMSAMSPLSACITYVTDDLDASRMISAKLYAPNKWKADTKGTPSVISVADRKRATFFFLYENNVLCPPKVGYQTTIHTDFPVAILKYNPRNDTCDIYNFGADPEMFFKVVKHETEEHSLTIDLELTNKIDVKTKGEIEINPIIADTIVLDTDKYYVTDYDPEFGFDSDPSDDIQDNKQLVYENSEVVSADQKYEPAYNPTPDTPALNNDIPVIIEAAKDSDTMTLDTPTVGTDYTCKNNYSVYFNILGKAKYDTKRDYILNYEALGDDPGAVGLIDTSYKYSPISKIKIDGWGEDIPLSEYFNTDADDTLKLDFYGDTGAEGLLIKDTTPEAIADYMTQYSDYCKNYSVYEAAVAASTDQIALAVMYWTKAAQEIYCEILDAKRDFESTVTPFRTIKSDATNRHVYCRTTYCSSPICSGHDKYHSVTYDDPSTESNANKTAAEKAEAELKKLTPKLYDITGWTTQWSLKYDFPKGTSQCSHCDEFKGMENEEKTINGSSADKAASYGSVSSCKLNFKFKTASTSEPGVKYGNTPSAVKSILKEVKNNGTSELSSNFYTAGILGKLCDTLSDQLLALADLEESRPHAEIKIYCDYEVPFDNGVFIDNPADNAVPEYLVAFEWADQKPFMKPDTLLTSLLDFDGRATTPEALLPRVSGKTLSTATRDSVDAPVMLMKYDSAKIPTSDLKLRYEVKDEDSGSDKTITKPVIRWSYADWTNLKAAYDALIADGNESASTDIIKDLLKNFNFTLKSDAAATEESSEWVETKHGRYLVNMLAPEIMENAAFTATELDACAYVIPKVAVWTSIWRLENGNEDTDANSANVYLPIEDWLKAWKVEDSFNTVADNSAKIGSTQSSPITISGSGVTYLDLYKAQMANMADKGAEAVVGVDTTVSNRSTYKEKGTTEVSTRIVYPSQILNTINASYYLSGDASVRTIDSIVKPDMQTKFDDASWISSAVPLKLTSQFSHFNISWTDAPESGHDNDMVLKRTDEADGAEAVKGVYNRDNTYTVFPMVKTGYFEPSDKDPIYNYAFVSGQESRTFTERTFYKVGILGAATPTVVANMIASDARARHLRDLHNGAPVAYSGTGLTVSYDTSAMVIAMQTFSLINKDAGEAYQEGWGDDNLASKALNDGEGTSAHSEFLEMMGGTQVSAGSGNVGMAIPYVAGSDVAMKTDGIIRNHAWQLASQTAGSAIETETYASTHSATDIQLIVEKAELVGIILPEGSNVVGTAQFEGIDEDKDSSIGDDNMMGVANSGTFISDKGALDACGATGVTPRTTAATLKMLAKMGGGYAQIAEALRGIGITGSDDDFLKKLFAHNEGEAISPEDMVRLGYSSEQAKKIADSMKANLTKAESDKWYNEYCNCLALRYECTTFKMQPVILTDKIPIEMGPQTPADHSLYFSNGYDFTAAAMLLKFLGAEDGDAQAMAEERGLTSGNEGETMFDVWYIGRNDGNVTYGNTIDAEGDTRADIHNITDLKPDVVISDVPATNANF